MRCYLSEVALTSSQATASATNIATFVLKIGNDLQQAGQFVCTGTNKLPNMHLYRNCRGGNCGNIAPLLTKSLFIETITKMTGGAPEVRSDKILTLLTFGI